VEYLGIDWSYRRAAWCSLSEAGVIVGEGAVPADADGLARLVIERGTDVRVVVEMMSGAIWVRDQLAAAGWRVQIAHARKVRDVAPLACKTDKVDARVLAELCRRDLVPELWVPPLEDRRAARAPAPTDAPRPDARLGDEPHLRLADAMGPADLAAAAARP
jgi:transposase